LYGCSSVIFVQDFRWNVCCSMKLWKNHLRPTYIFQSRSKSSVLAPPDSLSACSACYSKQQIYLQPFSRAINLQKVSFYCTGLSACTAIKQCYLCHSILFFATCISRSVYRTEFQSHTRWSHDGNFHGSRGNPMGMGAMGLNWWEWESSQQECGKSGFCLQKKFRTISFVPYLTVRNFTPQQQ